MCLLLKKGSNILKAERKIICWKIVKKIKENKDILQWVPYFVSDQGAFQFNVPVEARKIEDGKLIEIKHLESIYDKGDLVVIEGFHAKRKLRYHYLPLLGENFPCICIIPKSSEYAIGEYGDIVSTQIIVFSSIWKFLRYLIWEK